ncbi:MAG: beta-propeller fold lactonase family protein [Acidobacteriaceae bacterium]
MKRSSLRRSAWPVAASLCFAALLGCGDQYRPVAIPIPQSGGPQPATAAFGLVLSNTGPSVQGIVTTINLPGDTNQGQFAVGVDASYVMTPDGTRALATSRGEDSLNVYSPISVPLGALGITALLQPNSSPVYVVSDGATAWTANPGRNGKTPTVGVVSLSKLIETAEVPVGNNPVVLSLNQAYSQVDCVNQADNTVTIISTKDNSVLVTLPVGVNPVTAVTGSNTGFTFVVNQTDGTVSQIDPNSLTVAKTLTVGTSPSAATYSPALRKLFVADTGSNTVSILDVDPASITYQTVTTVPVGTRPVALTALADGSRIFVANAGSNDVTVIDGMANRVLLASIPVGNNPISIASSANGSKVIVVNQNDNSVSLIETTHYAVTGTVLVPATPIMVTANP